MASKRNSRVFEDDGTSARSVRSVRNSKEDLGQAAKESSEKNRDDFGGDSISSFWSQSSAPISSKDMSSESSSSTSSIVDAPSAYTGTAASGRPHNFGVILPGVYRSSYPQAEHFDFLQDLGLKTVVTLVKKDEIDPQWTSFVDEHQIRHITFDMKGTKKESIPMHTMKAILDVVYDASNYPLLMHCNQGKHRTGCVVGVMRKLSGWSLPTVLDEYRQYAEPKIRECDVEYLTSFETNVAWQRELQAPRAPQLVNRTFLRALALTVVVVFIWLFSANRLSTANHGGTQL